MLCVAVVLAVSAIGTRIKERESCFGVVPFLVVAYGKERGVEPMETLTASLLGRAIARFSLFRCSLLLENCKTLLHSCKLFFVVLLIVQLFG